MEPVKALHLICGAPPLIFVSKTLECTGIKDNEGDGSSRGRQLAAPFMVAGGGVFRHLVFFRHNYLGGWDPLKLNANTATGTAP